MSTLSDRKQKHLNAVKISGSISTVTSAQKVAVDKQGHLYKYGSNHISNKFTDKNGKSIKQNNVVKWTPAFFRFVTGDWQIFPSASSGRNTGDGEITLVNDTNGWNFTFDSAKHKNFVSASFIEFVEDGPQ